MVREWRHDKSMILLTQFPSLLCHFIPEVKVLRDHDGISLSLLILTEGEREWERWQRDCLKPLKPLPRDVKWGREGNWIRDHARGRRHSIAICHFISPNNPTDACTHALLHARLCAVHFSVFLQIITLILNFPSSTHCGAIDKTLDCHAKGPRFKSLSWTFFFKQM